MSTLKIIVTGICAFKPGAPPLPSSEVPNSKLRIIMPASNRRKTTSTYPGVTPAVIPVHLPFFATTAKYVINPPARVHDMRIRVDLTNPKEDRLVWLLEREFVTFSADDGDTVRFVNGTPASPEGPPPANEEPYVYWIADMRKIWSHRQAIRADCLQTTSPANDVAVHVELNGGKLSSFFAVGEPMHVAEVVPSKAIAVKQVLTRKFMIEMPIVNNVVVVKLKSLDTAVDLGEIRLDGTDIDVMLGNTTLQDVYDLQFNVGTGAPQAGRDNHFELYYDILKDDSGGNKELPVPFIGIQGAHHNCPPLMTE